MATEREVELYTAALSIRAKVRKALARAEEVKAPKALRVMLDKAFTQASTYLDSVNPYQDHEETETESDSDADTGKLQEVA